MPAAPPESPAPDASVARSDGLPNLPAVPAVPFPDAGHGPYRFMRGAMARSRSGFEAGLVDARGVQARRLRAILAGAEGTAFARDHGLTGREDLAAFRAAVPVRTHASLSPWLDRVVAGEPDVLTRAPVRMFLETSGTTGHPKWLPVTDAWARTYGDAQELWVLGLLRDDEGLRAGKAFSIVSSAARLRSPGGLPVGANTGRMFLAQPWWLRMRAPIPYRAYLLDDPEVRAYTLLRIAMATNVVAWTTANPSTILLYTRRMREWWDELSADIAEGTLRRGPAAGLADADRRRLWWWLRRRALPAEPVPTRIWPLRRINCWKGGASAFFLDRLPDALGAPVAVREAGVNASEGYFAIPVDDGDPVAHLGGHLLEFIPEDESDPAAIRSAWELEVGRTYRLVVTTEAGLYRYDLADLVRVTGWCGEAPRLVFVRKAGSVLNATGEKVTEAQVLSAVGRAMPGIVAFSASLGWAEVPWQRLAVEGATPRGAHEAVDAAALAARYDEALSTLNVEYASKRETGRLGPPEVTLVPPGTFAAWRAARIAAGAPEAQVKDPLILDPERWDTLVRGPA